MILYLTNLAEWLGSQLGPADYHFFIRFCSKCFEHRKLRRLVRHFLSPYVAKNSLHRSLTRKKLRDLSFSRFLQFFKQQNLIWTMSTTKLYCKYVHFHPQSGFELWAPHIFYNELRGNPF